MPSSAIRIPSSLNQFLVLSKLALTQAIHFSIVTVLKISNTGAELGLATPLTTTASVSFFWTRIVFIYISILVSVILAFSHEKDDIKHIFKIYCLYAVSTLM